jgi:hypothetical protein
MMINAMQRWHHGNFANSMYEQLTGIPMYKGIQPQHPYNYNAIVDEIIHNRTEQIIGGPNYIKINMSMFFGCNPTWFAKNPNWFDKALINLPTFIDRDNIETTAQTNAKVRLETIEKTYNELMNRPIKKKKSG